MEESTENLKIAYDACAPAVNGVKKVKNMKYDCTLRSRDSIFVTHSTYCKIVEEQALSIVQHSERIHTQHHTHIALGKHFASTAHE